MRLKTLNGIFLRINSATKFKFHLEKLNTLYNKGRYVKSINLG